ncbi:MAG: ElyC/SanA/YdcF family protein [Candidatus Eremiobacteraeota bacterium]|nr:ElyC/SanA/YdcF family protein [Candidatus Eremiobacteraeota bacterium]
MIKKAIALIPVHRKWIFVTGALLLSGVIAFLAINFRVKRLGLHHTCDADSAPAAQAAIVLGAYVDPGGVPCPMLEDRIITGVELYGKGKVKKLVMSGDHGLDDYDEVNSMRRMAEDLGVPPRDIFMDHAGFCTYDSMYRARDVFGIKTALIVTQEFHLARSIYNARMLGIDAHGVKADRRKYPSAELQGLQMRESVARIKDFLNVHLVKPRPRFLGNPIPIEGDGSVTHDRKD